MTTELEVGAAVLLHGGTTTGQTLSLSVGVRRLLRGTRTREKRERERVVARRLAAFSAGLVAGEVHLNEINFPVRLQAKKKIDN